MTTISGAVALVTGGQRGLGREITRQLLEAGAAKVYATSRASRPADDARIVPLAFELTDPQGATALAREAADVSIVVNNAGIMTFTPLLADDQAEVDRVFDAVAFGPLRVAKAFAPVLAANGGGALVNLHSVTAWIAGFPGSGTYGAAKAALISMTNNLRAELAGQGTQVLGAQFGLTDTDLVRDLPGPKNDPAMVAAEIITALAKGETEVLADDKAHYFKPLLSGPVEGLIVNR
ncbi:SDR family NAD(P)-dependent oxidoreductase [Micromonospora musae]|uniref:SDR family NAD(P)-dependent oxidoreductase n=1 Tax=Micromonospora musae TaxID=1894970 RepID=A0A3A9Y5Q9_9ACTN|nr:SDR family oxidoreductase [Micromonospora musae]RKN20823.1 SDR family NAD(P)-dependent oxidoreductase [Micromonospora musae]RKN32372.1 SDR family NAD(P)-dependent oxidoreductase [Micromonospora musae]